MAIVRPLAPAPPNAAPPMADLTRRMLQAPIAATVLGLAAPNVVVITVQSVVNVMEAVFVGWLGADALAGVALVFPLVMLMQMMSAGGVGSGVASAVARALGAGRRRDADALVLHAVVIAAIFALVFTVGMLWGGPAIYRAMGGTGGALTAALGYSNVIFAGAGAVWLFNILAAVLRGAGHMTVLAVVVMGGSLAIVPLSAGLIWGWGPLPRLGIAGAALALVIYHLAGAVVLGVMLLSGRSLARLRVRGMTLCRAAFADILRVAVPGALSTVQTNLTAVLVTAVVGGFGTMALAGYGMGARLEYLQIPLVFGLGSALVTMVGTNIGAGQLRRARRIALVGAGLAFVMTEAIGLLAAIFPEKWLGLFTRDREVILAGSQYLHVAGPSYGFFGAGVALYFASLGAGRALWPLGAGFGRLVLAAGGSWLAVHWLGGGVAAISAAIAGAFAVHALTLASVVGQRSWPAATQGDRR